MQPSSLSKANRGIVWARRLNAHKREKMLQRVLMMDRPLLISTIIEHAAAQFGDTAIVSRETHGPIFRYTFAECALRVRRWANALRHLGLEPGASVASLAWNNHRHLEAYYAVSGSGMVM